MNRHISATVLGLAVLLSAGCSAGSEDEPFERFREQISSAPAGAVLPTALPPELVEGSVTTIDGVPVVDFSSTNQPTVSVCAGTEERCAEVMPFNVVLRTVEVDGSPVVLSLNGKDDPAAPVPALKGQVATFWSDVDLAKGTPAWARSGA